MNKRIELGQIEPAAMKARHDILADEMLRRKYNHQSPYEQPDISYLPENQQKFKVNVDYSLKDLFSRCPDCLARSLNNET